MNAVSALTAVGPTYIFPVIQALKDSAFARISAAEKKLTG